MASLTSVVRVFSCSHGTSLMPAYCACRAAHSRLAQQHSAPTIWALAERRMDCCSRAAADIPYVGVTPYAPQPLP